MTNKTVIFILVLFGYCVSNPVISRLQIEYGTNVFANSIQATVFFPINRHFDIMTGYQIGFFKHQSDSSYDQLLNFNVGIEKLKINLVSNLFDLSIGYNRNGKSLKNFFTWFGIGGSYYIAHLKEENTSYAEIYSGSKIWKGFCINAKIDVLKIDIVNKMNVGISIKGHYTALPIPQKIDLYGNDDWGQIQTFTFFEDKKGKNFYNIFYPEIGLSLNYSLTTH